MLLEQFFASMRKGEFKITSCKLCKKKLWPQCKYCSSCFSTTTLRKVQKKGILVEFTKSYLKDNEVIFGLVELSGVRVMGRLFAMSRPPRIGMRVRMTECGINTGGAVFYNFEPEAE